MPPVVLVVIDGLRPDAIDVADCPRLHELRARSAFSMWATSVMPSVTLPCHMAIFHSVPPARHGIVSNIWAPMARPLPGLADLARAAGLRCGFFYNWEPLRNLSQPGSLAMAYFEDSSYNADGDRRVAEAAASALAAAELDFAFVYLGTVDVAGHNHGWMSAGYLAQIAHADAALGTVLDALPDGAALLLQSDHGGHERNHGTDCPEDLTIPWIVAGAGIRRGHTIAAPVSLLDTAPTLARLLSIAPHRDWEGHAVEEIFEAAPVV